MRRTLAKTQSGFSLVELMVVVAIIGILATIAIPNFTRFQNKARQSEAKSNLSSIYSAQMAFRSEWNAFRGDFRDIGYGITSNNRLYKHGFTGVGAAIATPNFVPSAQGAAINLCFHDNVAACAPGVYPAGPGAGTPWATAAIPAAIAALPGGCGTAAAVAPTAVAFLAQARSRLAAADDIWTMSETKALCNTTPGI